jgi:hypothetical protein
MWVDGQVLDHGLSGGANRGLQDYQHPEAIHLNAAPAWLSSRLAQVTIGSSIKLRNCWKSPGRRRRIRRGEIRAWGRRQKIALDDLLPIYVLDACRK